MRAAVLALLAGCGGGSSEVIPDAKEFTDAFLTPHIGYRDTCDGSGGVAIAADQFLDISDEDQQAHVYVREVETPVQTLDISTGLGVAATARADLEDLARIGNRIFAIGSHGRTPNGDIDRTRYKLGAFDLASTPPNLMLTSAGTSSMLLDQMLVAANWDTPNTTVITALQNSSNLGTPNDPLLAPEISGTNIEAIADDGTGKLLIGFRNPRPNNNAIVVKLANPDEALTGTAHFTGAVELDLGGLGIRAMTYSAFHQAILIIAGPPASSGLFRLYKWSGDFAAAPTLVTVIQPPLNAAPEAVIAYPSFEIQVLYDSGDVTIMGLACRDAPVSARAFRDDRFPVN